MRSALILTVAVASLVAQPALTQIRVPGPPRIPATRTPSVPVPTPSHDDDASCPGNLIVNGGFDVLTGAPALTSTGVPVATAPGWTSGWQGPSTSRVFSHSAGVTAEGQVQTTLPGLGNHLAMYVTTHETPMGPPNDHRLSAALGQLRVTIPAGSGTFALSLRTSRIVPGGLLTAGIYGVRVPAGSPVPAAPSTTSWESILTAFGPENVRWLGFVDISTTQRAWQTHNINFNAQTLATGNNGAQLGSITHILIHGGLYSSGVVGNAVGFDSFCLRSVVAS